MKKQPLHDWTPTVYSHPLSQRLKKNVWLKMENFQPPGSYKIRGIGRLCRYYKQHKKTCLVSSSGGNAGVAVAYAGRKLGLKVTVFLPKNSHPIFVSAIEAEGAEVIIQGEAWDEANQAALAHVKISKGGYVPPFDHPLIWAGHATIIDEVIESVLPDVVVVAVGGGGLACGLLEGLHKHHLSRLPLIAVETEGAASFHAAVAAGQPVTLEKITSIATTLGAKRICQRLWEWTAQHEILSVTVSDNSAIKAVRAFLEDHRSLVEPACGAALSVLYDQHPLLQRFHTPLVIVCGGIGVSTETLKNTSRT